jgi:hypothetical protein
MSFTKANPRVAQSDHFSPLVPGLAARASGMLNVCSAIALVSQVLGCKPQNLIFLQAEKDFT